MEEDERHYLLERYAARRGRRRRALSLYYAVKPLLPRRVQLALRRAYAPRQARAQFPAWPIEPLLVRRREERLRAMIEAAGGESVPVVNDWPDGRRFAAVLTHDVEGPAGVDNVMRVIEVEHRHGLVSSWNFVAEWYPIPDDLFERVRAAGCEVGLHGIKHDGRLFESRASFEGDLPLIHRYLHEWDAVGFRSPATHRNADWMPELGCLYDTSFPDTDPFEPQPGGCCSIHPFLIDGLVELPITLVQDHTLWEVLRRHDIGLWVEKSRWIAEHRGLINLILHPDYVLDDERLGHYDRFCAWLRGLVDADRGWHALPREVAEWWKAREGLRVEREGDGARVTGEGGPMAARATVAWASLRDRRVVVDG